MVVTCGSDSTVVVVLVCVVACWLFAITPLWLWGLVTTGLTAVLVLEADPSDAVDVELNPPAAEPVIAPELVVLPGVALGVEDGDWSEPAWELLELKLPLVADVPAEEDRSALELDAVLAPGFELDEVGGVAWSLGKADGAGVVVDDAALASELAVELVPPAPPVAGGVCVEAV